MGNTDTNGCGGVPDNIMLGERLTLANEQFFSLFFF